MNNTEILDSIISILEDKKAKDIKVLEVKDVTLVADYFVICSGTSTTHIKTLADELEIKLEDEKGIKMHHREGYNSARWILLDYSDVIVHVFHQDDRMYYNLEKIWSEAKDVITKDKFE
ncbi:MAG: ribosome silencing factor [Deltaproteobacteria bacterium]